MYAVYDTLGFAVLFGFEWTAGLRQQNFHKSYSGIPDDFHHHCEQTFLDKNNFQGQVLGIAQVQIRQFLEGMLSTVNNRFLPPTGYAISFL
jgi:hypothetical protein